MPAQLKGQQTLFITAACLLLVALFLGGGQGTLGDTLAQLLALLMLGLLYIQQPNLKQWPKASLLAIFIVMPALWFVLPMGFGMADSGPAREQLNALLNPEQIPLRMGLNKMASERAFFWILPAIAMYLACVQFSIRKRRKLAALLIGGLLLGAVIGLAQKATGADSLLYFFRNTNRGASVGFFANANHYAISMAASLPLVWAGLTWLFNKRIERHIHPLWFLLMAGIAILFILGFMLSGSRAGIALGMFGCLLMLPAIISADQHQGAKHWVFAIIAVALFLTVQVGLYFISLNFVDNPLQDGRFDLFSNTVHAAQDFAPFGAGPGSFWFVYPRYDDLQTGQLIANHAHNDYLELWLEMRWLFVLCAITVLIVYFYQTWKIWRHGAMYRVESTLLARVAGIGLFILLLHSMVDYPLRTTAISVMAAMFAAFMYLPETERFAEE